MMLWQGALQAVGDFSTGVSSTECDLPCCSYGPVLSVPRQFFQYPASVLSSERGFEQNFYERNLSVKLCIDA